MDKKYRALRGRTVEKMGNMSNLAKALGTTKATVSNKFNGKVAFTQQDIKKIQKLLDIDTRDIWDYFFTDLV